MAAFGRGQPLQLDAVIGNEFFVGGDEAFARFQCTARPGSGGIEAADELHNHVHIRGQHGIGIFAPDDARGRPVHTLARHAAIEDVGQLETSRLRLDEDPRHRAAHRAKAEDGDAQMARGAGFARLHGRSFKRRCGTVRFRHRTFLCYGFYEAKARSTLMIPDGASNRWSRVSEP